jgi:hypothetical protein
MKRNERTSKPEKYEDALPRLKQMILQDELRKLQDRLEKMNQVVRFKEDGKTPATATS